MSIEMIVKSDSCRLCLKRSCKPEDLNDHNSLIDQILLCFSYQLINNENHPHIICDICSIKLRDAISFKRMIIENDKVLKNVCKNLPKEKNISSNIMEMKSECKWNTFESDSTPIRSEIKNIMCSKNIDPANIKHEEVSNIPNIPKSDISTQEDSGTKLELDPNTCLICFRQFSSKKLLLKHYLSEENDKYNKLMSEIDLNKKSYTKMIDGNHLYVCNECGKEFTSENNIKNHLIVHGKEWPFSCKLCGRMYVKAVELVNHGKSHSTQKFICSYKCGFSSGYQHIVKNHEIQHKNEKKYTCQECGKSFQVKTWFEQHQNMHKGVKQFVCKICGASFFMERYLTRHISALHPDVQMMKRYNCMNCAIICNSKNALNLHLQEHGIKKEFLCDICGKVLKNASQLKLHRRIHNNDRPYVCGICNKTFSKKFNLTVHQTIHTNEKHECSICLKTYSQRSSLKRHEARKHAKEEKTTTTKN